MAEETKLPTWEQANKEVQEPVDLPTWDDMAALDPTVPSSAQIAQLKEDKEKQDAEVMRNIPDQMNIWGMDVTVPKQTTAFWIGAGDAMTWVYRGALQMMGMNVEGMQQEQKAMNDLYKTDAVGTWGRAGQIYGSVFEPVGMLTAVGKSKTVTAAVGKGFGVGATYGAMGYVDESQGSTRLGNSLMGGTLGGVFNGAFQGIAIRGDKKAIIRANNAIDDLELSFAETVLKAGDEATPAEIYKQAVKNMPSGFSLTKASAVTGRRFMPPMTKESASEVVQFYKGTYKKSDIAMGADSIAGIVSTRIRNISEPVLRKLRQHDKAVLSNQHHYFGRVDGFLSSYDKAFKFNPKLKQAVDAALLDGDHVVARNMMKNYGGEGLVQQFDEVTRVLDELGDQAVELGLIKSKLNNYFPRYIKDRKKLLERLGRPERSQIESAIRNAELKRGRGLSSVEETDVINKALRGYTPKEGKSPFTKARSYKRIPSILREFYSSPEESLHSYIRNMVNDVEKYKFFGRNMKTVNAGGAKIFDEVESVGELVRELRKTNPMSRGEERELASLLQTRFGIGERSPLGITQNVKNMLYVSLLGNPIAAATQLGDIGVSIYMNGFKNTMKAIPKALRSNETLSVKAWGLTDQLAEEFATTKQSARWLHRALKYSGFKYVDRLGKDTMIHAAFNKFKAQVRTPKGIDKFRAKYGKFLGDDFDGIVKDLKAGEATEGVQGLLFSELADVQPISLSEVPEQYLKMPNGRIMYMLKTFMLKQVDILRRDMFQEIAKGTPESIAKGFYNGARYAIIMGAAGTGSKVVKDTMLYGPTDQDIPLPDRDDIPAEFGMNAVKTFGWSEYVLNSLKDGKPYQATMDAFAPPFEIVDRVVQADKRALDYMPIAGKLIHYWLMGGAKDAAERKQKREIEEMLDLGDYDLGDNKYDEYLGE